MRRLLFLFCCGILGWVVLGARDVAPPPPAAGESDADVETLIHRSQVVSTEFSAAFMRARAHAHRANHLLGRAAHELTALAGD